MDHLLAIALVGVAGGVISATLGVGGGILFVPALVIILGVQQKLAQGTSLAALTLVAAVGAALYKWRLGVPLDLRVAAVLGVCGAGGALLGSMLVAQLPVIVLRRLFAIFMVIAALKMWFTPVPAAAETATGDERELSGD